MLFSFGTNPFVEELFLKEEGTISIEYLKNLRDLIWAPDNLYVHIDITDLSTYAIAMSRGILYDSLNQDSTLKIYVCSRMTTTAKKELSSQRTKNETINWAMKILSV